MKNQVIALGTLALTAFTVVSAQNQSVLDLLRSIQPGAPSTSQTPAQPQPAAAPATPAPAPPAPTPALDTKPAFMSIITNYTYVTNVVIVTNYVVVTNMTLTTNLYNAQGQLLMPVQAAPIAARPLVESRPTAPAQAAPDPAVVRSNKLQAVRDLLWQSLNTTSNALAAEGGFANNPTYQIKMPEGVTSFDRRKAQNLTVAMNTAAEKAVPALCAAVQKAIAGLNPPDPAQILEGGPDAATRYLLSTQGQNLANEALTIVQGTAAQAHVADAYNAVMLRGGGLLGAVLGSTPSVDMNAHITKGVMQALFLDLSARENTIRTDPAARKTKALQNAFGK